MTSSAAVEATRGRLGPVGVFGAGIGSLGGITADQERDYAKAVERLGYGSLWLGEGVGGREVFVRMGIALAETTRLTLATGIANVWARHALTTHAAAASLADAYPNRFVLGVGIGSQPQAWEVGEPYRPMARTREYLDEMDRPAGVDGKAAVASPDAPYARVLAAVGPKMLELAAERTDGAHPFVQPVELTAWARRIIGPDKLLVPQQSVMLVDDREEGLARAAEMMRMVSQVPAYAAGYRRLGFTEEEIATPSRRLIEAVVAVGDEERIAARVRDQLSAGADHVLIMPMVMTAEESRRDLERLAPALLSESAETPA